MQDYPSIYTDGVSLDVSFPDRATLLARGLVVSHPGAGEDGIVAHDLKLAEGIEWRQVTDALADLHREAAQ